MNGDAVLCLGKLVGSTVNSSESRSLAIVLVVIGDLELAKLVIVIIDDALYNNVLIGYLSIALADLEVSLFANLLAVGYDLRAEVVIAKSDLLVGYGSLYVALLRGVRNVNLHLLLNKRVSSSIGAVDEVLDVLILDSLGDSRCELLGHNSLGRIESHGRSGTKLNLDSRSLLHEGGVKDNVLGYGLLAFLNVEGSGDVIRVVENVIKCNSALGNLLVSICESAEILEDLLKGLCLIGLGISGVIAVNDLNLVACDLAHECLLEGFKINGGVFAHIVLGVAVSAARKSERKHYYDEEQTENSLFHTFFPFSIFLVLCPSREGAKKAHILCVHIIIAQQTEKSKHFFQKI